MKTITILSGRCLLVELPEGYHKASIGYMYGKDGEIPTLFYHIESAWFTQILPEGNWQIVGRLSELTEVQAAEIVPQKDFPDFSLNGNPITIRCYDDGTGKFEYTDALESLDSAIRAEGYEFTNQLGTYEDNIKHGDASDFFKAWQEAQPRVLDRSRCLLLRRVEV